MRIFLIIFCYFLASCNPSHEKWSGTWAKHETSFKQVVALLKADKLTKVYGRSGYAIPSDNSIHDLCGGIVFQETDFTYDSTHSILFRINFDSGKVGRILYPVFIYTNNTKRIKEYELDRVTKIQDNWYFLHRL